MQHGMPGLTPAQQEQKKREEEQQRHDNLVFAQLMADKLQYEREYWRKLFVDEEEEQEEREREEKEAMLSISSGGGRDGLNKKFGHGTYIYEGPPPLGGMTLRYDERGVRKTVAPKDAEEFAESIGAYIDFLIVAESAKTVKISYGSRGQIEEYLMEHYDSDRDRAYFLLQVQMNLKSTLDRLSEKGLAVEYDEGTQYLIEQMDILNDLPEPFRILPKGETLLESFTKLSKKFNIAMNDYGRDIAGLRDDMQEKDIEHGKFYVRKLSDGLEYQYRTTDGNVKKGFLTKSEIQSNKKLLAAVNSDSTMATFGHVKDDILLQAAMQHQANAGKAATAAVSLGMGGTAPSVTTPQIDMRGLKKIQSMDSVPNLDDMKDSVLYIKKEDNNLRYVYKDTDAAGTVTMRSGVIDREKVQGESLKAAMAQHLDEAAFRGVLSDMTKMISEKSRKVSYPARFDALRKKLLVNQEKLNLLTGLTDEKYIKEQKEALEKTEKPLSTNTKQAKDLIDEAYDPGKDQHGNKNPDLTDQQKVDVIDAQLKALTDRKSKATAILDDMKDKFAVQEKLLNDPDQLRKANKIAAYESKKQFLGKEKFHQKQIQKFQDVANVIEELHKHDGVNQHHRDDVLQAAKAELAELEHQLAVWERELSQFDTALVAKKGAAPLSPTDEAMHEKVKGQLETLNKLKDEIKEKKEDIKTLEIRNDPQNYNLVLMTIDTSKDWKDEIEKAVNENGGNPILIKQGSTIEIVGLTDKVNPATREREWDRTRLEAAKFAGILTDFPRNPGDPQATLDKARVTQEMKNEIKDKKGHVLLYDYAKDKAQRTKEEKAMRKGEEFDVSKLNR